MGYNLKTDIANRSNYGNSRATSKIKYIVIHYTGNDGDTDEANGKYFKNNIVKTSAHYFVDGDSVTRSVPDNYIAWHCGGGLQGLNGHAYWLKCTNTNSVGIELCDEKKNGKYDFTDATINNAVELVKDLMKEYNIPVSNVIRHYDVTGKKCPKPFVEDEKAWNNFKAKLTTTPVKKTSSKYMQNSRVKSWQIVMNKVYKCKLAEDGSFGPDSQAKANKYQLYKKKTVATRMKNDYVKWLQNRLKELSYKISVDGSFWNDTDKIVKQFQREKALKVDGFVGANTVRELLR